MKQLVVILCAAFLGSGLAYGNSHSDAEEEDLVKAKSKFRETWVKPDADFTKYNKIKYGEAGFQFRDVDPARRTSSTMRNSNKTIFGVLDAACQDRLVPVLGEPAGIADDAVDHLDPVRRQIAQACMAAVDRIGRQRRPPALAEIAVRPMARFGGDRYPRRAVQPGTWTAESVPRPAVRRDQRLAHLEGRRSI